MKWLTSRRRRAWRRQIVEFLAGRFTQRSSDGRSIIDTAPERVAIIRPNHRLGNILMLTPLVQEIESIWPAAQIDIVGGGRLNDIFKTFSSVRKSIQTPKPALKLLLRRSFVHGLPANYDLVINVDPQSQSARLISRRLKAKQVLEPPRQADHLDSASRHMALQPVDTLRSALPRPPASEYPPLSLKLTESERIDGHRKIERLAGGALKVRPIIGLYPFGDKGRAYPLSWWDECVLLLRQRIPELVLIEVLPAHGQTLLKRVNARLNSRALRDLCAQLGAMDLVLATDSGMMHLAASSGATTFGLFRVTDRSVYAPYGGQNRAWDWRDARSPEAMVSAVESALGLSG
ncbi:glycosyltransferase family 9 protein [Wenzhouxiangella limi]|uniref:Glycosyltransferase family 9 protein n=1 Tax=Wenzhouxiangella limi TaxID=2707351 RepID=A0A845V1H5_9GAMM|nr:glycosyltransferase family 9 protein [Wenzhouxiangella limi]NDY95116.1 glycosyltransferase family 9 protein [Wenzhouxiangella limi]